MYKTVILVAGHHNNDSGAVADGIKESDLTKVNRDSIKYFLNKLYPEITVLTDDDSKKLSEVISWINSVEGNNSLIYDLHWNSAIVNTATGVEAFVADNSSLKSKQMAAGIVEVISTISGLKSRGVKTESASKRGRLGILHTKSPATIVEIGFINNKQDREKISKYDGWLYEDLAHEIAKQAKL